MAKINLASTVREEDIVDSNEEVGSPNFMIDDTYGCSGGYGDYALVERKVALRTGKPEDGENFGKVIRYIRWDTVQPHSYGKTPFDIFNNYAEYINLKKFKQLNKSSDFNELKQIYLDTQSTIRQALKSSQLADDIKQKASLVSEIEEIKGMLSDARKVFGEVTELRQLVKDSRKIIVSDMENKPKQHRTPKEKEE